MNDRSSMDSNRLRQSNVERVLSLLKRYQPVSRTDIARITELSPSSVTRIIGVLQALGLAEEYSLSDAPRRGRKAVNLRVRPDGIYTLGVHIDPGCLRLCLLDFDCQSYPVGSVLLGSAKFSPEALASAARSLFNRIPSRVLPDRSRLHAVGISLSGRVDTAGGDVTLSDALDWTDVPLGRIFSKALDLPAFVENDVRACLAWERTRQNIPEDSTLAYLYLGQTGIGFASNVNGGLVHGHHNRAGEIDQIDLGGGDALSNHLLERRLLDSARQSSPSVQTLDDLLAAWRARLPWAWHLAEDYLRHLHLLIHMIEALLDPCRIILSGQVVETLAELPGLLPDERCVLGDCFEESCANGAALTAMQAAVRAMIAQPLFN